MYDQWVSEFLLSLESKIRPDVKLDTYMEFNPDIVVWTLTRDNKVIELVDCIRETKGHVFMMVGRRAMHRNKNNQAKEDFCNLLKRCGFMRCRALST